MQEVMSEYLTSWQCRDAEGCHTRWQSECCHNETRHSQAAWYSHWLSTTVWQVCFDCVQTFYQS